MEEEDLRVNRSRGSRNLPDRLSNLHLTPCQGLMETPQWILLCLEGAKALRVLLPPLRCQQASLDLGTSGRMSRAQQPWTQALPGQAGRMLAGGQGKPLL